MTRLFLAAGVAALAIAAPTAAKPGGGHGGQQAEQQRGGNGGGARAQRGGGGGERQAVQRGGGGGQRFQAQRMQQPQRQQFRAQQQSRGVERQQMRAERQAQGRNFERQQMRAERQAQGRSVERQQLRAQREAQGRNFERQQMRAQRQAQGRNFERQQMRASRVEQAQRIDRQQFRREQNPQFRDRALARDQLRNQRFEQAQNAAIRNRAEQFRVNTDYSNRYYAANRRGLIDGCPPGLWAKNNGCMPPGQAQRLLGAPLAAATGYAALNALPRSWGYLYPETPNYYYRYGDGYLYQVNRSDNLISALLPLMAGGYLPGQYLPQPYMASYVPNYYGFNSFYPDYGDDCNRYANGVIYEVDCYTGMVEDVIPVYAGGYGVGQILPASYAYYNVPYQYRTMYYDTPNYNYWYAPGAIYQYDPGTSMITSVAALLSPGFTVGQSLPMGYDAYNVPYDYRATYYDTPNAWYRYNNGYIYQVDPTTRLVTAIVASLLT